MITELQRERGLPGSIFCQQITKYSLKPYRRKWWAWQAGIKDGQIGRRVASQWRNFRIFRHWKCLADKIVWLPFSWGSFLSYHKICLYDHTSLHYWLLYLKFVFAFKKVETIKWIREKFIRASTGKDMASFFSKAFIGVSLLYNVVLVLLPVWCANQLYIYHIPSFLDCQTWSISGRIRKSNRSSFYLEKNVSFYPTLI